ncbi:tail protein X [Rhizobium leguminosarum]|uniref:tail protein X n=1 Tax=Rhizobium leguminosarum TaxID=384 RepID=UPI000B92DC19|nr:tail protein X [Rhizobium leguminosarum]ASS57929.1 phage tail protein [Rhizobium leguminosarum bv. viciae]
MAGTYTSRQGETVDLACWRYYGRTAGVMEAVLTANPGLAAKGPILPIGTVMTMPDAVAPTSARQLVKLWD